MDGGEERKPASTQRKEVGRQVGRQKAEKEKQEGGKEERKEAKEGGGGGKEGSWVGRKVGWWEGRKEGGKWELELYTNKHEERIRAEEKYQGRGIGQDRIELSSPVQKKDKCKRNVEEQKQGVRERCNNSNL